MRPIRTLVAGLASLSLLLTACSSVPGRSGAGTAPAPIPTAQDQPVTLKVAGLGGPGFAELVAGFYEKYPNYRIERVNVQAPPGAEYVEYLKQQMSLGTVDVIGVSTQDPMTKAGLILPLEPFVQKSKFDLKPYGPVLDQLKYEGKLYGLPYLISPQVLVYNADLFQAAGAPLPKDGWTWEDFRQAAAKIAKGDGENKVWGFYEQSPDYLPAMYVQLKTGYEGRFPPAADMKEALQFFQTMIFTDKSMLKAEHYDYTQDGSTSQGSDAFGAGKAGMRLERLFGSSSYGKLSFKMDIGPLPVPPGGKNVNYVDPRTMGIAVGSKHPQAAWEFLMYAAGQPGGQVLARQGLLPLYRSDSVKKAWFDQQPTPTAGTEFLFTTTFALPASDTTFAGKQPTEDQQQQLNQAFSRSLNAVNGVLSGAKSVADAIRDYSQAQDEARKLYQ